MLIPKELKVDPVVNELIGTTYFSSLTYVVALVTVLWVIYPEQT
jgi:hypothetical protein